MRRLTFKKSDNARRDAIKQADNARDLGDPARAATLYDAVIERWEPTFGLLVQLGNALKDSGAYARAEDVYRSAQALKPDDADLHLQFGHLMKLSGNFPDAERYYAEATRLDPRLESAQAELRFLQEYAAKPRVGTDSDVVASVEVGIRSLVIRQRIVDGYTWRRG